MRFPIRQCLCHLVLLLIASTPVPAVAASPDTVEPVVANDNRQAAGVAASDAVLVHLRAALGRWQPEGPGGPALTIEAFGEEGGALSVPAPLVRVTEGTWLAVSIRNELNAPLLVHGLCARDGNPCVPVEVPAASTREVRFASGRAGTYHYWATTMNAPVPFRELAGALIVDPASGPAGDDRIFVITEWTSLTPAQLMAILAADAPGEAFLASRPRLTFVINGLSWPATERLTYRRGEAVRWRVINLSSQPHPMHLHGFYFTVTHAGDGRKDQPVANGSGRRVVTQLVPSGGTIAMEWTPETEGNWLFHCHVMFHVSPERRLDPKPASQGHGDHHGPHANGDAALGMAGMVLGITVLSPIVRVAPAVPAPSITARRLTLTLQPTPRAHATGSQAGVTIDEDGGRDEPMPASSPGPPLVLRRGEPVEITVRNLLDEATSIHWHGLEIDSLYDGVHGWSGSGQRVAPMIAPGASFVVRMTPPRAGTFIYHTHLHDYRQLTSGLYGPLIVTDEGERFDAATDHVAVLGRADASEAAAIVQDAASALISGQRAPRWTWHAGARHRLRLINITPDDVLLVSLVGRGTPVTWRPLAKDGAAVPSDEASPGPAQVRIAVGETYDFEYAAPPGRGTLWLEVRSASGRWQAQGEVVVK